MPGKLSVMRRGSTRTTAPSAPRQMSSHMKPKRSWPGVPNRYITSVSSTVMRPKSMATVVVVLPWMWRVSSMPVDALVIAASVRSGSISEIAPTKVVLPTPKPPAMTNLTDVVHVQQAGGDQVVRQDHDDTHHQVEVGGDLGDRQRTDATVEHELLLVGQVGRNVLTA